jgi:hypothetical protein
MPYHTDPLIASHLIPSAHRPFPLLQGLLLTQHVVFCGFSMRDENWCRLVEAVRSPLTQNVRTSARHVDARGGSRSGSDAHNHGSGGSTDTPGETDSGGNAHGGESADGGDDDGGGEDRSGVDRGVRLGTILALEQDRIFDSLWEEMLHVTCLDQLGPTPPADAHAVAWHARSLEVFLDHVASAVHAGTPFEATGFAQQRVLFVPLVSRVSVSRLAGRGAALPLCIRFTATVVRGASWTGKG